jgi:hypothetical protein
MQPSLTTALLLLGALALLALVLQGWWRTRRLKAQVPPVAPRAERVEPVLVDAATVEARAARRGVRIDALIDAVVTLALDTPISGEAVLAHQPATRRAGSKPMLLEARDADSGEWAPPQAGGRYDELQAAVQMAHRGGAINEIEYSEFVQKVQAFADAIGAAPDFPDMLDVVARARELDGLTSPLDAQLSVTLRANSVAWSAGYLQQAAARHGFTTGALPGRLVVAAAEEGAPPLLVLSFDAQAALADETQRAPVRECALLLDVPQTPEAAGPFPLWHRMATALAEDIDASLVDDHGRPITLHAFAAIGSDLAELYRRLESLDLAAGSAVARRLFS